MDYDILKTIISRINLENTSNYDFGKTITVNMFLGSKIIKHGYKITWKGKNHYIDNPRTFFTTIVNKEQRIDNELFNDPDNHYEDLIDGLYYGTKLIEDFRKKISFIEIHVPFTPKPLEELDKTSELHSREVDNLLLLKEELKKRKIDITMNLIEAIYLIQKTDLENELKLNLKAEHIIKKI